MRGGAFGRKILLDRLQLPLNNWRGPLTADRIFGGGQAALFASEEDIGPYLWARMVNWHPIALVAECPPGTGRECVVEGRIVALFNVAGTFYALDGVCPHQGGPLGKGCLTGELITCPWHGWQFNVCSGQHRLSQTLKQPRFALRVEGDQVLVSFEPLPADTLDIPR